MFTKEFISYREWSIKNQKETTEETDVTEKERVVLGTIMMSMSIQIVSENHEQNISSTEFIIRGEKRLSLFDSKVQMEDRIVRLGKREIYLQYRVDL